MTEKINVEYSRGNAPKGIKVMMDYSAEPIWITDSDCSEGGTPCIPADYREFPFPPALMHLLYCYREMWESAHTSRHIPLSELEQQFASNLVMSGAIKTSIESLGSGCEKMLEEWLEENGWDTQVYRQSTFL
ncbi:hypothetical protein AB4254_08160 [Vibrio breoganii]